MDCVCGCGKKLNRGLVDANLQASRIALELLAWDRERVAGRLGHPAADDAEGVIRQGADRYQWLLRVLHGEDGFDSEPGDEWLERSLRERRDRRSMTKQGMFSRERLKLDDEDIELLDRRHPELSFSGAGAGDGHAAAGGADIAGQLERLAALHSDGVLSDAELAAAKARVIDPEGPRR